MTDLLALSTSYGLGGAIVLALDIIAIYSLVAGRGSFGHKFLWTVLILLFPCGGIVLYYLFGRSPKDA